MKNYFIIGLIALFGCNGPKQQKEQTTLTFSNKGHELIYNMVQKVGNYDDLKAQQSVEYIYRYTTASGQTDSSLERYLFDGELSFGRYLKHERTLPQLNGTIEQGFDGENYWLKHNDTLVHDSSMLKRVAFNRPTNFYWFCMMPKLLDPGLSYEYLGTDSTHQNIYDVVKVTFSGVDYKPKDIYQLYINQKTSLVDHFLFTIADFKISEPKLMQLEYEEVDNFLIPTKRRYTNSNWNAEILEDIWTTVKWSNISFNAGLTKQDFAFQKQQ